MIVSAVSPTHCCVEFDKIVYTYGAPSRIHGDLSTGASHEVELAVAMLSAKKASIFMRFQPLGQQKGLRYPTFGA